MKVAYISHHQRPNYELPLFSRIPGINLTIIDTQFDHYPPPVDGITYAPVTHKETFPYKYLFSSTAKPVYYANYEKYLADVDVIIVLELFSTLSRQFAEYAHRNGKKVVVLVYELLAEHPIYKLPMYYGNTRKTLALADKIICVSRASAAHLTKLGANPDKVIVVYPGVDRNTFQPTQDDRNQLGVVFVGKLEPNKGIDQALEIAQKLVAYQPNSRFTFVGSGSYAGQVKALANQYPQIEYLGQLPNDHIPAVLSQNAIYILPARDTVKLGRVIGAEQYGFSVVEAMSCGLAVLSTQCGAIPEMTGYSDAAVPQGDTESLWLKLKKLIDDPESASASGSRNMLYAQEHHNIEKQALKISQILNEVATH